MKRIILLVIVVLSGILMSFNPVSLNRKATSQQIIMSKIHDSLLRHVVLFKFKEGASPEKVKEVEVAFKALPSKITQIVSYEWGLNNSPEGLAKGFTHCFFLTFKSEEDRAIYLPHPDHKAFGALLSPILDDVLVIDYWAN